MFLSFRLAYALLLIKTLLEECPRDITKIPILYDIACILKRHLTLKVTQYRGYSLQCEYCNCRTLSYIMV